MGCVEGFASAPVEVCGWWGWAYRRHRKGSRVSWASYYKG